MLETVAQLVDGVDQLTTECIKRDAEASCVGVVSGLTFDVIVRVIQVLYSPSAAAHQPSRYLPVLRWYHVGRSVPALALIDVTGIIHAFAVVQHFIAGCDNCICRAFRNGRKPCLPVLLSPSPCHGQTQECFSILLLLHVEVFNRSQSVHTVVGIRWNFPVPKVFLI